MASVPEVLAYALNQTDLDLIAITDHDQIRGALDAVDWRAGQPGDRLQVVVGTEISAAWGRHLLALFFHPPYPERPFPRFRSLGWTVAAVHDAGGIVAVPHPLSALVPSVGQRAFSRLLAQASPGGGVQAIEVCSGVVGAGRAEPRLRALNEAQWRLAQLGSSDAHHLEQIGSAYTSFEGHTAADLAHAIQTRRTGAHWGRPARVPIRTHVRQGYRSLVVKPARELRALVASWRRARA